MDVHQPGGDLLAQLLHPSITVFEQMYRTSPTDAWFASSVSGSSPVQFEIGSYRVPQGVCLWLQNYEFSVFRPSGQDAGDFVRAEDDRFSNTIGFDLTINGTRPGSIKFQLDPSPPSVGNSAFSGACAGSTVQPVNYMPAVSRTALGARRAKAQKASGSLKMDLSPLNGSGCVNLSGGQGSSVASQGTSLLPPRRARQGAPAPNPFTFVVRESQALVLSCVIFRPLKTPIAFVQADIQGYLLQTNASEALLNRLRPR